MASEFEAINIIIKNIIYMQGVVITRLTIVKLGPFSKV